MSRIPFSVRFPVELAEALDRIADHRGQSRSDLVETIIGGMDAEDRDAVMKTAVVVAPTEKRNLRLSPDTLTRLKQLASDLEPSDFLRRTIAYVVSSVPPEWLQGAGPSGNGHGRPASPRTSRDPHALYAEDEDFEVGGPQGGAIGLAVVVLLVFGALVSFIVRLIFRRPEPPSPGPSKDFRGQLPGGPAGAPGA